MKLFERWRTPKKDAMPWKFNQLAVFNSERDRGIVHMADWKDRMAEIQKEFNAWVKS
jgi:hypothetical protein